VSFEQIPFGGDYDLDRNGLIVICEPRISPSVAAFLAQDPNLRFEKADKVWTITDRTTGLNYRSGQDVLPPRPTDCAYLARLLRPDGQGTVLTSTGIHPAGTLGVVRLLLDQLQELHRLVGAGTFSTLVEVEHDPGTGEPIKSELATPVLRPVGEK
jgi:hypothetical protein